MAGNYPDVPGFRFPYDRDGSALIYDGSYTGDLAHMVTVNDEDSGPNPATQIDNYIAVVWPEPRSITGVFIATLAWADNSAMYVSANTTNGADGTWTFVQNVFSPRQPPAMPDYCRTHITPITGITNVRGVRFVPNQVNDYYLAVHVYGQIPLTSNPDRLVLCDATGVVVTNGAYFDFGDAARSTTAVKTFRIKNNSATFTANSIALSFQQNTDASPTLDGQFQYSFTGGSSWTTSGNIGNLSPGALSPVIQLRRNTLASAAVGPCQSRVVAIPASMT